MISLVLGTREPFLVATAPRECIDDVDTFNTIELLSGRAIQHLSRRKCSEIWGKMKLSVHENR